MSSAEQRRLKRAVLEQQLRLLDEEDRRAAQVREPIHSHTAPLTSPTSSYAVDTAPPQGSSGSQWTNVSQPTYGTAPQLQTASEAWRAHYRPLTTPRPSSQQPDIPVTATRHHVPLPSPDQLHDYLVGHMKFPKGLRSGWTIDGQVFDVYRLFGAVIEAGGSSQITAKEQWPSIANYVGLAPSSLAHSISIGRQLRVFFLSLLGGLEVLWESTKPAGERSGASSSSSSSRSEVLKAIPSTSNRSLPVARPSIPPSLPGPTTSQSSAAAVTNELPRLMGAESSLRSVGLSQAANGRPTGADTGFDRRLNASFHLIESEQSHRPDHLSAEAQYSQRAPSEPLPSQSALSDLLLNPSSSFQPTANSSRSPTSSSRLSISSSRTPTSSSRTPISSSLATHHYPGKMEGVTQVQRSRTLTSTNHPATSPLNPPPLASTEGLPILPNSATSVVPHRKTSLPAINGSTAASRARTTSPTTSSINVSTPEENVSKNVAQNGSRSDPPLLRSFEELVSSNVLPLPKPGPFLQVDETGTPLQQYARRCHELRATVRKGKNNSPRQLSYHEMLFWNRLLTILQKNPNISIPSVAKEPPAPNPPSTTLSQSSLNSATAAFEGLPSAIPALYDLNDTQTGMKKRSRLQTEPLPGGKQTKKSEPKVYPPGVEPPAKRPVGRPRKQLAAIGHDMPRQASHPTGQAAGNLSLSKDPPNTLIEAMQTADNGTVPADLTSHAGQATATGADGGQSPRPSRTESNADLVLSSFGRHVEDSQGDILQPRTSQRATVSKPKNPKMSEAAKLRWINRKSAVGKLPGSQHLPRRENLTDTQPILNAMRSNTEKVVAEHATSQRSNKDGLHGTGQMGLAGPGALEQHPSFPLASVPPPHQTLLPLTDNVPANGVHPFRQIPPTSGPPIRTPNSTPKRSVFTARPPGANVSPRHHTGDSPSLPSNKAAEASLGSLSQSGNIQDSPRKVIALSSNFKVSRAKIRPQDARTPVRLAKRREAAGAQPEQGVFKSQSSVSPLSASVTPGPHRSTPNVSFAPTSSVGPSAKRQRAVVELPLKSALKPYTMNVPPARRSKLGGTGFEAVARVTEEDDTDDPIAGDLMYKDSPSSNALATGAKATRSQPTMTSRSMRSLRGSDQPLLLHRIVKKKKDRQSGKSALDIARVSASSTKTSNSTTKPLLESLKPRSIVTHRSRMALRSRHSRALPASLVANRLPPIAALSGQKSATKPGRQVASSRFPMHGPRSSSLVRNSRDLVSQRRALEMASRRKRPIPVVELVTHRHAPAALDAEPLDRAKVVIPISKRRRAELLQRGVYDMFRDDDSENEDPKRRRAYIPLRPFKPLPRGSPARSARPQDPESVPQRFLIRPGQSLLEPYKSILTETSLLNRCIEHPCGWQGCDAVLGSESLLKRHVAARNHAVQGRFTAGIWSHRVLYRCHWKGCEGPCFDSVAGLRQHMTARHISRNLICPYPACGLASPNISHLSRHVIKQHDEEADRPLPEVMPSAPSSLPFAIALDQPLPTATRNDLLTCPVIVGTTYQSAYRREWVRHKVQTHCVAGDDPVMHVEHPPHMLEHIGNSEISVSDAEGMAEERRKSRLVVEIPTRNRSLLGL